MNLPRLIADHRAALVRGHGAFAGGKDLEEAAMLASVLESVSRIAYLHGQMKWKYSA
jgi:ribulose-5-phosphate 4-epimerase/fuculose-1-phosphate aldolase